MTGSTTEDGLLAFDAARGRDDDDGPDPGASEAGDLLEWPDEEAMSGCRSVGKERNVMLCYCHLITAK
jgi:hypothetical protein